MSDSYPNICSKISRGNVAALLPIAVFALIYVLLIIACNNVPEIADLFVSSTIVPAFLVAFIVAILQNRKVSLKQKAKVIGHGIGDKSIISMIFILLLAGIFAGTVGKSSAESVAFFLLDIIPPQLCVGVVFAVACLVSLAMGTSVGSITLITPIAITVSQITGQNTALCVASVVGGSMFGDNLSMISDTTIASTTGQGCNMRDKFFANFRMVIPAALITLVIVIVISFNAGNNQEIHNQYDLIEFVPYIIVLVLGLCGINVFIVLGAGIVVGAAIVVFNGTEPLIMFSNMIDGMRNMYELIIVTILVAGMAALIKNNGGFNAVLLLVSRICKDAKSALLSIGVLVSIVDIICANNTIAIVVSNPIAKEVGQNFGIAKRRVASMLDISSCVAQGLLPYGSQIMIASTLCVEAGVFIGPIDLLPFCLYQFVLIVTVVIGVLSGYVLRQDKKWKTKQESKNSK